MESILIILISVIFSAFFSGMEIAFVSANKLRLEFDTKQHSYTSVILSIFSRHPEQYLITMMLGNIISLAIYGIALASLLSPFISGILVSDAAVLLPEIIFAALAMLLAAEFLPRLLSWPDPNMALRIFSVPLIFFYGLFYPLAALVQGLSARLFPGITFTASGRETEKIIFSKGDLDHFIHEQDYGTVISEHGVNNEVKLFRNALDFSKVKLREIMVPRTEIAAIDVTSSFTELRKKFIETGYSRILFYQDNIDNIVGYIHHSTIFANPESIRSALKKVLIVPETMSASRLLSMFIQEHRSIAIVVDEFGGTSGMVTSEDILEEIFGEIEDEHDTTDFVEKQVSADEYIFSARIDLDMLNEKYDLGLPTDENYETLAGFILFHYESIPKVNAAITIGRFHIKILKATNTRIELVNLKVSGQTS
ncbi:MAG: hemolysin family protein [Prolixibacteraceae bacterium]